MITAGTTPWARHAGAVSIALAMAVSGIGLASPASAAEGTPENAPPVAQPDTLTLVSGKSARVSPLANDSDPDPGDTLTLTGVTVKDPAAGTVTRDGNDVVVRAAVGFVGSLVATYTVSDSGGLTATATITAKVTPVPNRAPVARPDKARVSSGRAYRIKVLANDSDPDGDRISLVRVYKPTNGSALREGNLLVYRGPAGWAGTAKVTYAIRDARGATARSTLTLTVVRPVIPTKKRVELALARLRLPTGTADGIYDSRTQRAVCAWRMITGRPVHRGLPSTREARAIMAMTRLPRANASMVTGVNVSVTCQAALWVGSGRTYKRVMPACTGAPGYRTRVGTWRIFVTHRTWRWSTLYPEARMYKPMQFSGGQALHGSATDLLVKTYPASHGCVRMLHRDIDAMQAGGVGTGTLVRVIGTWRG